MSQNGLQDDDLVVLKYQEKSAKIKLSELKQKSKYFEAMLSGNFVENGRKEVDLSNDINSEDLFNTVVEFVKTGTVDLSKVCMEELVGVASYLAIDELLDNCRSHMIMNLDHGNVAEIHTIATKYTLLDILPVTTAWVSSRFHDFLIFTEDFQDVTIEQLQCLIESRGSKFCSMARFLSFVGKWIMREKKDVVLKATAALDLIEVHEKHIQVKNQIKEEVEELRSIFTRLKQTAKDDDEADKEVFERLYTYYTKYGNLLEEGASGNTVSAHASEKHSIPMRFEALKTLNRKIPTVVVLLKTAAKLSQKELDNDGKCYELLAFNSLLQQWYVVRNQMDNLKCLTKEESGKIIYESLELNDKNRCLANNSYFVFSKDVSKMHIISLKKDTIRVHDYSCLDKDSFVHDFTCSIDENDQLHIVSVFTDDVNYNMCKQKHGNREKYVNGTLVWCVRKSGIIVIIRGFKHQRDITAIPISKNSTGGVQSCLSERHKKLIVMCTTEPKQSFIWICKDREENDPHINILRDKELVWTSDDLDLDVVKIVEVEDGFMVLSVDADSIMKPVLKYEFATNTVVAIDGGVGQDLSRPNSAWSAGDHKTLSVCGNSVWQLEQLHTFGNVFRSFTYAADGECTCMEHVPPPGTDIRLACATLVTPEFFTNLKPVYQYRGLENC